MRAVFVEAYAANLSAVRVGTQPAAVAKAGSVLIAIAASSVNPIDFKVLDGSLAKFFPLTFPQVLQPHALGHHCFPVQLMHFVPAGARVRRAGARRERG